MVPISYIWSLNDFIGYSEGTKPLYAMPPGNANPADLSNREVLEAFPELQFPEAVSDDFTRRRSNRGFVMTL